MVESGKTQRFAYWVLDLAESAQTAAGLNGQGLPRLRRHWHRLNAEAIPVFRDQLTPAQLQHLNEIGKELTSESYEPIQAPEEFIVRFQDHLDPPIADLIVRFWNADRKERINIRASLL
jgi:hypothetical protein